MKTFGQILEETDWPPVWEQLQKLYNIPDEGGPAYKRAFDEACGLAPARTLLKIEITECDPENEESGGYRFDVSGVDENGSFGIEFSPWSEWKGMEILPETLEQFSTAEIAAHCLEEMTFAGFSQQDIDRKIKDSGFIRKDDPWGWLKLFIRRTRLRFGRKMTAEEVSRLLNCDFIQIKRLHRIFSFIGSATAGQLYQFPASP